jgi:hypothetical protein
MVGFSFVIFPNTEETTMQISDKRDYLKAFFLVLFAGTIWSFGALIVRYMEAAQSYQWQYLFYRGMTVAILLLIYLLTREGLAVVDTFKRTGLAELIWKSDRVGVSTGLCRLFGESSISQGSTEVYDGCTCRCNLRAGRVAHNYF